MDESVPLRRSTRSSSVALKNEELTPRKRKVSTPVKVEPSTPSRRTRASSATPKKNLIEAMSTPKKTLPVLNEEENTTSHTPAKKLKETSPKTPSRRRLVRESVSTPTRVSIDKSTKKPIEAPQESNVTLNRPLTRAKRKTMGEIQVAEVTKTSEPEKAAQNKKDKPEAQKRKTTPDKADKSAESNTEEESCLAKVPKVVVTDLKKQDLKEAASGEKAGEEESECGTFTSKSPVRAEDVAISSPRKVPESCKSISEVSLISDKEKVISNSPSSEEKTDTTHNSPANITAVPDILIKSPKKIEVSKDLGFSNATTPPEKVVDAKENDIPNITITSPSPRKVPKSKGAVVPNIVISSPSPQKVSKSEDKNKKLSQSSSEKKTSPRKSDTNSSSDVKETDKQELTNVDSEITTLRDEKEVKSSSPQKIKENNKSSISVSEETDENSETQADTKSTKNDLSNEENTSDADISSLQHQSPKKVDAVKDVIRDEVNKDDAQVPSDEIPLIEKEKSTEIENKDSEESNKTSDKVEPNDNLVGAEKSSESDSKVLIDENNVPEIVANTNESVMKDDTTPGENENIEENDESKSISAADESFELNISDIDEINAEDNLEEADKTISVTPGTEDPAADQVKSEKDESKETGSTITSKTLRSPDKIIGPLEEDKKVDEIPSINENIENNCGKVGESLKEALDKPRPICARRKPASSPPESNSGEIKPKDGGEAVAGPHDDHERSPTGSFRFDCEISSDSADSGIQHDASIRTFKSIIEPPRLILSNDNVTNNDCLKQKDSLKKSCASGSGASNAPSVDNENKVTLTVDNKTETLSKNSSESLNESLMSANDFLNSEEEGSSESEKGQESGSSPSENKPSEDLTKTDVDNAKDSKSETEETSLNITHGDGSQEISTELDKEQDDCDVEKSDNSETKVSPAKTDVKENLNSSQTKNSELEDSPVNAGVQERPNNSETKSSPAKTDVQDSLKNSPDKTDVQESQNNSEIKNSPAKTDLQESLNNAETMNSPSKTDVQENLNSSQTNNSPAKTDAQDSLKNSPDKTDVQGSLNNSGIKDSPAKTGVQETINSPEKTDLQGSLNNTETMNSPSKTDVQENLNSSQTKNSPAKSAIQESLNNSEIKDSPAKTGVQESPINSETKSSPAKTDVQESLKNSPDKTDKQDCDEDTRTMNSPAKAEQKDLHDSQTTISPCKVGQKSLDDSQIISSPKLKADNFTDDDSDSTEYLDRSIKIFQEFNKKTKPEEEFVPLRDVSESDGDCNSSESLDLSTIVYQDFINKTTKSKKKSVSESDGSGSDRDSSESLDLSTMVYQDFINKTTKSNNKKIEPECDGSQSDGNSELSIPSNVATEGSSEGPLTGRDFIDFEAEEGEETEEEDSFIVQSGESSSEASSDEPEFDMSLRKRKANLETDRREYSNSVKASVDSSEEDEEEDNFIKNKKQKLEKKSNVNKKTRRPKSIMRNKETVIESVRNIRRNRSKTDIEVVKEQTKTGVFIVSSISQDIEEPKLSRKTTKSSKSYSEKKKSTISQEDLNRCDTDDAALRGFVVSYDESYFAQKKPRKEVNNRSESISKKKKIKEGKIVKKKTVKKSLRTESKEEAEIVKESPYVVTLVLPLTMKAERITSVLADLGISDISSISFPKPKIASVEFSNKEPFKKLLGLYGMLKYNNKPIYILEGCSVI